MADKTNKKKENKHWFKDFRTELKKVTWQTPKQLAKNTAAVIVMVLIVAIIVFVLDFVFETANKYGIEKLKGYVQPSTEITQVEDNAVNTESNETSIDVNQIIDNTLTETNVTEQNVENTNNNVVEE